MRIRNCSKCGRIYSHVIGVNICPQCKNVLEDKLKEVKTYIYEHKHADIKEVSDNCSVSVSQIKQWIREDILQFSDEAFASINCEKCGKTIKSGRLCEQCNNELIHELNSAKSTLVKEDKVHTLKKDTKDKMRYFKNHF